MLAPISFILPLDSPLLQKLNEIQTNLKYCLFMMFFFVMFIAFSLILVPVAWIIGIFDKTSKTSEEEEKNKTLELILFIFLGPFILIFDIGADIYYFWKNSFRPNLNKIVV